MPLLTPDEVAEYESLGAEIDRLTKRRQKLGAKFKEHMPIDKELTVPFGEDVYEIKVSSRVGPVDYAALSMAHPAETEPDLYKLTLDTELAKVKLAGELAQFRKDGTLVLNVKKLDKPEEA